MPTAREYITFYRIHTVALSAMFYISGYMAAGNGLFTPGAAVWWLAATLWHATAFAHNNLFDYYVDRDDPHKSQLPHCDKNFGPTLVGDLTFVMGLAAMGFIIWLAANDLARIFFAISVVFGILYNKTSKWHMSSILTAALCYFFIPLVPYTASGGNLNNPVIWLMAWWAFAQIVPQNAWLGNLKDYHYDKTNWFQRTTRHYRWLALYKLQQAVVIALLFVYVPGSMAVKALVVLPLTILMFIGTVYTSIWMYQEAMTQRSRKSDDVDWVVPKICGYHEMLMMLMWCTLLSPLIGWVNMFVLFLLAMFWYFGFNRLYWGTFLTPKV
jgi:4-hydroxybenzoate polyprenyltransferase